jgi:hypothetical protein
VVGVSLDTKINYVYMERSADLDGQIYFRLKLDALKLQKLSLLRAALPARQGRGLHRERGRRAIPGRRSPRSSRSMRSRSCWRKS